jgi:hypothetical protein
MKRFLCIILGLILSNLSHARIKNNFSDCLVPKLDPSDSGGNDGGNHRN